MQKTAKTVLLVDDNKTFVMYAGLLLNRMGLEVIPSSSGYEALKLLKMLTPDLVMLDINMPELDGPTLLRQIRNDPELSGIPVIMASSDTKEKHHELCERLQCDGYLEKPVTPTALHDMIKKHITFGTAKREKIRAAYDGKVTINTGTGSEQAYATSLSHGGIYIRKRDPLPIGTSVEILLAISTEKTLVLKGKVIYKKEIYEGAFKMTPGMAIQFSDIAPVDSEALRSYIEGLLAHDIVDAQEEPVIRIN